MCGIVGHVTIPGFEPARDAVRRATACLAHRGPDGEGIADLSLACLGHRRLGIIDLAGSPQPWRSEDGRYVLVFNGELYNYLELRRELEREGLNFRSQGDTEVLLAWFIREGARCLRRFNGMFAFAVWDDRDKSLTLVRDRIGKKPLYYAEWGEGVVFASELEAISVFRGLTDEIDYAAVNDFFSYQYIPFERSIYRRVRKLPPAHIATFHDGSLRLERYWSPPLPEAAISTSAPEQLRALVEDAVRLRLRSDVPIGAFLSGGVDSAIVVATLKRLDAELCTYTIGFDEASFDERAAARATASHFGVEHREAAFSLDLGLVQHLTRRFGEPYADVSALPAWYLCRHARSETTVALSGDGADELFAGYRRYLAGYWLHRYTRIPGRLRRSLEAVVARLPEPETYFGHSRLKQLKLFLAFARRSNSDPADCLAQTFDREERQALFNQDTVHADSHDIVGRLALGDLDTVERMLQADLQAYLPEDILTKIDRVSMDHALEVRAPLLDYRIVEFASRLPLAAKLHGSTQKWILKEAFRSDLPAHVLRGPKQGFAVPLGRMLRISHAETFLAEVEAPEVEVYLQRHEIERLWREHTSGQCDHGMKLWTIFVFAAWLRYRREMLKDSTQ